MESPFRDAPPGLRVIETLRLTPSGPVRGDRHLARMARTCVLLGLPFDEGKVRAALDAARGTVDLRARLSVGVDGLDLACTRLPPAPTAWTVALAELHIAASDPWRSVKTTHRAIYDTTRAALPADLDEMIFLNDSGRIAEGTITNIFVERGGTLATPPVEAGALPGILREELLETGRAEICDVAPDDLRRERFYCGNSLRGLILARLAN
ncbi:aminotransferase class IV [Palleronia sp.]|uniref:aminotransferase class IV n=1 Tax=Palleronia sp. TaxID=1940284 RepID=UPI0035C8261B